MSPKKGPIGSARSGGKRKTPTPGCSESLPKRHDQKRTSCEQSVRPKGKPIDTEEGNKIDPEPDLITYSPPWGKEVIIKRVKVPSTGNSSFRE